MVPIVHRPSGNAEVTEPKLPVLFLAGPIQGAPDWHAEAIDLLNKLEYSYFEIASPRRLEIQKLTREEAEGQYAWEHYYLDHAAKRGIVLFWLANEAYQVPGRSYAQTTRFELGEHATLNRLGLCDVVVGIEPGFTNEKYLRYTLKKKMPAIQIFDNLQETITAAVSYMPCMGSI